MNYEVSMSETALTGSYQVSGSKSESNRLLILQTQFPQMVIENLSNSDDTRVLQQALNSRAEVLDVHHAGTAMRFLTAFLSLQEGRETILTGSSRMQERPIQVLVDALSALGADITYERSHGYPPLKIKGKRLLRSEVDVPAGISSQYISALMLIAPMLKSGLKIHLQGAVTSLPYIQMTLQLLNQCGINASLQNNSITISSQVAAPIASFTVESDWSSASYFYSMAALSDSCDIHLNFFKDNSLQGDRRVAEIYRNLGVNTVFRDSGIALEKSNGKPPEILKLDLADCPDLAQTVAVTCFGLGVELHMSGLHTLRIKETDRLSALKNELEKLGGQVQITDRSLSLAASGGIRAHVAIDTYRDHRMALAFAPLALRVPIVINEAEVVSKSFPSYWEDLRQLGFKIAEVPSAPR